MRLRTALTTGAAALLAVATYATPATAGNNFTISVNPTTVHLEDQFTVTGTSSCANSAYTVTFSFTNQDEDPDTLTVNGTTDGSGGFTQQVTVPNDALPESDTDPSVQASIASCNGAGSATSNQVTMAIEYAEGVLATDKTSGQAGTDVHVSGTNCLGDNTFAAFVDSLDPEEANGFEVEVELDGEANTFEGDFTIPNVPPGQWYFVAFCDGTVYNNVAFTVIATPGASPTPPPPAPTPTTPPPPATPVTAPAHFTG
ncbi:MAG TPA: hypothetical protein VFQ85_09770 [Mycobacteriales bacterium]|jgi:uncharacterized membrane protein|nr:hypothetical protein [Mycobacteriales bacterium]